MFFLEIEEEQIQNEWWVGEEAHNQLPHNYLLFLLHRQPAPGTHKHIHKHFVKEWMLWDSGLSTSSSSTAHVRG